MVHALDSLFAFVAAAPNAMALFDREMRYLSASPRWLADHGLEQAPVGRSLYEVFPEIGEARKAAHRRCLAGATESCESERFERAGGGEQWVRWEARPWLAQDGAIGGIVVASDDITARVVEQQKADEARQLAAAAKELEDAVRRARDAERHLKEALDTIPGGFAIYDAEDRLVVFNKAVRDLYPFAEDDLRPGVRFEDLLRAMIERIAPRMAAADKERWIRRRMDKHRNPAGPFEEDAGGGRSLRIEEARMPDGGTVVIQTVTELRDESLELARKTAMLEATLHSMGEGILVYGPDRRLRVVNDKATQLLEAPAALFEPGASQDALNRFRAERGDFGDVDPDEAVRARIALFHQQKPWSRPQRHRNGRMLEVRFNPMPDGGGVFILLDVTEHAVNEAKLAEKTALPRDDPGGHGRGDLGLRPGPQAGAPQQNLGGAARIAGRPSGTRGRLRGRHAPSRRARRLRRWGRPIPGGLPRGALP